MARKVLEVFLSSTAMDLAAHRAAVHERLTRTGLFHCIRREDFGAQDAGAVEFCCQKAQGADLFVGLIGIRRGWEPDGDNAKRSITEMEHDWAAGQRERKASAEYWRHIGALAFLHNTQKAMAAYEKAVALDPDETEGWRYLGELQYRLGDLAAAEQSFRQVLALGQSSRDWRAQAIGSLRLEWIARARGDLAAAEKLAEQARQPREYVRRNGQQDAHVRVLAEGARPVAQNGAGGEGCRGRALAQASWLRRRLSRGSTK
jgi:tetratricopeptide (TPR) repeat protein